MVRVAILLVLGVSLLAPTVAAENFVAEYRVDVALEEARWMSEMRHTNTTADDIRRHIDEDHGNHDGVVSADEVKIYESNHIVWFNETKPSCFDVIRVVEINGESTGGTIVQTQRVLGAETTNETADEVRIQTIQTLRFPKTNASSLWVNVSLQGPFLSDADTACYTVKENYETDLGDLFGHNSWEFYIFSDNFEGFWTEVVPIGSRIHALPGYTIDRRSATPSSVDPYWDGKGWSESGDREPLHERVQFRLVRGTYDNIVPASTVTLPPATWALPIFGAFAVVAAAVWAWSHELIRIHLLRWSLVAGFSRLTQDDALRHKRREDIIQRIREQPGINFSDLRRLSEIPNGALVHHLRVLLERGVLSSARDGARIRYYPRQSGMAYLVPRTDRQLQLLETVTMVPGLTQADLAARLGWSRLAVHRSAKTLAASGDLQIQWSGRRRQYYPGQRQTVQIGRPARL